MNENNIIKEIKTCKICGETKPINEFPVSREKDVCFVCSCIQKQENLFVNNKWTMNEYRIILDKLINKKVEYVNDLLLFLDNKTLEELCELLNKNLKIKVGHVKTRVQYSCDECNKENLECTVSKYLSTKHHFCSHECADTYNAKLHHITKQCPICNKYFDDILKSKKVYCSKECASKGQSVNFSGENHPCYKHDVNRKVKCDWCKKEFEVKPYRIKQERHFCSKKCSREWFKNVCSQDEDFKNRQKEIAVMMLEQGIFNKTDTRIQKRIDNVLKKMRIKFDNEYNCKYVSIDNAIYFNNSLFFIECMGTYWHTDIRFYNEINYNMQVNRIINDKSKHTYIKNNYNIEILYLWEEDIMNNLPLCKMLIQQYLENDGILINYHSLNYENNNGKLLLKEQLVSPYMEWTSEELNKIINTDVKKQRSQKQPDKWTIFNCEYCGKEHEELTCHYNKRKHHYCGSECYNLAKRKRAIVKCDYCNTDIEIPQAKLETNKHFFCDQECQHLYQKQYGFKHEDKNITYKCEVCKTEKTVLKSEYDKRQHHFCSKECHNIFQRQKTLINV